MRATRAIRSAGAGPRSRPDRRFDGSPGAAPKSTPICGRLLSPARDPCNDARSDAGPAVSETAPRLSVAAPCFNEAEGIADVVAEWDGVLSRVPEPTEIVLCNDGSTDGTAGVLERLR